MAEDKEQGTQKATSTCGQVDAVVSRMKADECDWEDLVDYIQTGLFEFCGCGNPERNLEYIMNGLSYINEFIGGELDELTKMGIEIFGNDESKYFFFYWADKEELTDHGNSVPGWLTKKGEELLAALQYLKEKGDFDG